MRMDRFISPYAMKKVIASDDANTNYFGVCQGANAQK